MEKRVNWYSFVASSSTYSDEFEGILGVIGRWRRYQSFLFLVALDEAVTVVLGIAVFRYRFVDHSLTGVELVTCWGNFRLGSRRFLERLHAYSFGYIPIIAGRSCFIFLHICSFVWRRRVHSQNSCLGKHPAILILSRTMEDREISILELHYNIKMYLLQIVAYQSWFALRAVCIGGWNPRLLLCLLLNNAIFSIFCSSKSDFFRIIFTLETISIIDRVVIRRHLLRICLLYATDKVFTFVLLEGMRVR